jgi:uncharacterized protein YceK
MPKIQSCLLVSALFLSGCGTYTNTLVISETGHESYRVYGGLQNDFEVIRKSGKRIAAWDNQEIIDHAPATVQGAFVLATVCTLDIPLSFIADTLTLPLCVLFTEQNQRDARKEAPLQPSSQIPERKKGAEKTS